jgi:hypothetical protein
MGSAVIEAQRKVATDKSSGEGGAKVSAATTDGAMACHSFCEVLGGAAGVTGVRLSAGLAQQARLQHLRFFKPQHLHTTGAVDAATPVGTAKMLCQPVVMATKMARTVVTILVKRLDISFATSGSFRCSAVSLCQRQNYMFKFQLFSSPQASIAFPM